MLWTNGNSEFNNLENPEDFEENCPSKVFGQSHRMPFWLTLDPSKIYKYLQWHICKSHGLVKKCQLSPFGSNISYTEHPCPLIWFKKTQWFPMKTLTVLPDQGERLKSSIHACSEPSKYGKVKDRLFGWNYHPTKGENPWKTPKRIILKPT